MLSTTTWSTRKDLGSQFTLGRFVLPHLRQRLSLDASAREVALVVPVVLAMIVIKVAAIGVLYRILLESVAEL